MPLTFRASLWSLKSDHEREVTLVLKIPQSDYDRVNPVGKLTEQAFIVQIHPVDEVDEEESA